MDNHRPVLLSTEENKKTPLLIVDKKGKMGFRFCELLKDQFLIVLVSGEELSVKANIIHIPFRKKVPVIPDNYYQQMFIFYNGEEEVLDMLPSFIKKANATGSKIIFITSIANFNKALEKRFVEHVYHNLQVLVYGEVFGNQLKENNTVNFLLHQARKLGRVEVSSSGVGKLYPIALDDVLTTIVSAAFGSEKRKLLLVFPKHPISELTVGRMLQKQNPLLQMAFKRHFVHQPTYYIPSGGSYVYPDYPFEAKLKAAFNEVVADINPEASKQPRRKFKSTSLKFNPNLFWLTVFCFLIMPIIVTSVLAITGLTTLQLSAKSIQSGKLDAAGNYAEVASSSLSWAAKIGNSLFYLDFFMQPQKELIVRSLASSQELASAEVEVLQSLELLKNIAQNKSTQPKADFLQATAMLKNSLVLLQRMRAEGQLPEVVKTKLTSLESVLLPLENTADALPSILGFDGKKTYLLLFQNNMELRPGGGFIGSYGILTIENGKVNDLKISDVYDADGKLAIHVEPPFGLSRYLGSKHWFLRDSNFDIDFLQDAEQAKNFLQLETGEKVDGVMAIDTDFLKTILKAAGRVEVADYNEIVTADNFYLLTQNHAEKDFFPGSTQKKDFLRSLLTALQARLAAGKDLDYQVLANAIGESLLEKHLLLTFFDPATQEVFRVNNLSGSLWDDRISGKNTFLDFLGVFEANLGANKANYYLHRSLDQQVSVNGEGTIQTTTTVTYTNTSQKDSPFAGDYKDYVRFVLPKDAVLKDIKFDGVSQPTRPAITDPEIFTAQNFLSPKELEIENSQEQGKTVWGFLLIVPRGQTKKVTIAYENKRAVDLAQTTFIYNLKLFKQPGAQNDPYSLSFSYPAGYKVVAADKRLSDVGRKLVYSDVLSQDQDLIAEFAKK